MKTLDRSHSHFTMHTFDSDSFVNIRSGHSWVIARLTIPCFIWSYNPFV